ncbi:hypothetical protein BDE02_05G179800 [Populus trichocarpa]|nr:hypothetical protein BDE02_05G179800 [Populus trichocarpa]
MCQIKSDLDYTRVTHPSYSYCNINNDVKLKETYQGTAHEFFLQSRLSLLVCFEVGMTRCVFKTFDIEGSSVWKIIGKKNCRSVSSHLKKIKLYKRKRGIKR